MHNAFIIIGVLYGSHAAPVELDSCYIEESIDYDIKYSEPIEGYRMGKKVFVMASVIPFRNEAGKWFKLQEDAALQFIKLSEKAKKDGFNIKVNSAFRTRYEQWRLKRRLGSLAAKVGWSNHQTGTAVDIAGTTAFIPFKKINKRHFSSKYCKRVVRGGIYGVRCPTRLFWWLKNNAPKFGFFSTVERELWHFDYLGF